MKRELRFAIPIVGLLLLGMERQILAAFVDVTESAGIAYRQHNGNVRTSHQAYMSGGAAAGDFDGDGWVDLYVTRLDDTDILYRNLGNGTFQDVTVTAFGADHLRTVYSNGAAWGDIDNDGDLDLYVTSLFSQRYHLFVNRGDGQFVEQARERNAAIEGPDTHFGFSVTFGDYDRDGYLDLHTTEWRMYSQNRRRALQNTRLLRNHGAELPGHFIDVTQSAGVAMDHLIPFVDNLDSQSFTSRFTDLDGDGFADLAIASDHGTSRLFWNEGNGTFTDGTAAAGVGSDEFGMGSATGDIDNDGDIDWFVSSIYGSGRSDRTGNRLYRNMGARQFQDATEEAGVRDGGWGWGSAFFDYDLDGDLDLVEANGQFFPFAPSVSAGYERSPLRLWTNDGTGRFADSAGNEGLTDAQAGKGLLTWDYDRDGDLDLLVVNNGVGAKLYRNDRTAGADWLVVELVGTSANRQGIGAWVTIDPDLRVAGDERLREIDGGSHYLGQSPAQAHFGLGSGIERIDAVTVRWPDGWQQTLYDVPINQYLSIVQVPEPVLTCWLVGCFVVWNRAIRSVRRVHLAIPHSSGCKGPSTLL